MTATAIDTDAPAAAARTNRGAIESLTIRQRTTGEQAAARAAFTRRLRLALPIIGVILIAAFFLNTRPGGGDEAFLEDFADVEATPHNLTTAKPQFTGVDARGDPYEITAISASRQPDQEAIVELDHPRAVTASGDAQSVVAAEAGVFNTDEKKLLLRDGVTFERAIGRDNYVLKTPTATVSIDDQTLASGEGVDGAGPGGALLKADRMNADNSEGLVIFEGNVRMRLYPKKTEVPTGAVETAPEKATESGEEENE